MCFIFKLLLKYISPSTANKKNLTFQCLGQINSDAITSIFDGINFRTLFKQSMHTLAVELPKQQNEANITYFSRFWQKKDSQTSGLLEEFLPQELKIACSIDPIFRHSVGLIDSNVKSREKLHAWIRMVTNVCIIDETNSAAVCLAQKVMLLFIIHIVNES